MKKEEAIQILKTRFPHDSVIREALATVIPEFQVRESEDERIRKGLINMLSQDPELHKKEIAWLEKQKYDRMKPIYDARESFESALEKAWNDYHNGYENVDKLEDDYVECAHAKGFREGYLFGIEKQKDQKKSILDDPDLYSDWDKDLLEEIRSWLVHLDGKYTPYTINDIKLTARHFVEWQKQKEQKPNPLYGSTEEYYREAYYDQPEKEQKPAEPSDEELQRHQDELYDFKVFAARQAREYHISFVHDFEWNNFCAELLSYFNEKQKNTGRNDEEKEEVNFARYL